MNPGASLRLLIPSLKTDKFITYQIDHATGKTYQVPSPVALAN